MRLKQSLEYNKKLLKRALSHPFNTEKLLETQIETNFQFFDRGYDSNKINHYKLNNKVKIIKS